MERASPVDFVDTGTAAFRRSSFLEAGGFDESLTCAADVDLAYRLAKRGARFAFAPRAGVEHRHAERLDQYLLKKARFGFFCLQVYRRFPAKALGDSYTPPLMAIQIALAGLSGVLGLLMVAHTPGAARGLAIAHQLAAKPDLYRRLQRQTLNQRLRRRIAEGVPFGMALEGLTAAGLPYQTQA